MTSWRCRLAIRRVLHKQRTATKHPEGILQGTICNDEHPYLMQARYWPVLLLNSFKRTVFTEHTRTIACRLHHAPVRIAELLAAFLGLLGHGADASLANPPSRHYRRIIAVPLPKPQ
jgi:hypothetical protein